ncbi:MAG: hypothetical protein CML50_11930 [Rhodobacteraceae bacterium]|nr:hypothetical protein [Paracoccaceae bacterium]
MTIGFDIGSCEQAQKLRIAEKVMEVKPADVFCECVERPIRMKMIKEQPLFVCRQRDETEHLGLNPKKIADEPGLRIFPFAGSAGEQDTIRFRIAYLMHNV